MKQLLCLFLAALALQGCGGPKQAPHAHEGHHEEEEDTVHIKKESQELIDLELMTVQKKPFVSTTEVTGEIAKETENVAHVTSPEPGILKQFSKEIGETAEKDSVLATVETRDGKTIPILSPRHGIVMAEYVKAGETVDDLTSIITVADPDLLRASFNVYEKDLAGIHVGQKVLIQSAAYPDRTFPGKLVFISPSVDEKTRAIKIRASVENKEHLLKFGMFVTANILRESEERYFVIPQKAVHFVNGKRIVFVKISEDEFQSREVTIAEETKEEVAISKGLCEGDAVVVRESFLLKSELLKSEMGAGCAE